VRKVVVERGLFEILKHQLLILPTDYKSVKPRTAVLGF